MEPTEVTMSLIIIRTVATTSLILVILPLVVMGCQLGTGAQRSPTPFSGGSHVKE